MASDWLPPCLEGARVRLRPLREADAEAVFAYCSNPNMTRFTLWETHQGMADTKLFVRDYARSRYREQVPEPMGIVLRDDPADRVIGTAGCFWASKPNLTMELGYALAEPYWGRGLVAEASALLLDHVFANYPVERIQARCMAENTASARVMQKLGMTYEGTLRSALLRRGKFRDLHYYSILRGEWEQRRKSRKEGRG
ncbi:MAG TPA: GNAT family protein [Gemmataceae bacterium]